MKTKFQLFFLIGTLFFSSSALAIDSGPRLLQQIGCYTHTNVCFVVVSGTAVGPAECPSNTFVWDSKSANGRETLSLLNAAFHNNKSVQFNLDDQCSLLQNNVPGVAWTNVGQ